MMPVFDPKAKRTLADELKRQRNGVQIPIPAPEKNAGKTPTYNLTMAQIDAMKKEAAKQAVEVAWTLMLGLPCMPLMDKFGFTGDDLARYLDEVMDYYDSYEKGYISLQDVHDCVLEEAGADIIRLRVEARHKKHPKKGPYTRRKRG